MNQHPPLTRKIGALITCGFAGDKLDPTHPVRSHIEELDLGGVILFDRLIAQQLTENNITGREQLTNLTTALQECAGGELLICVDQEGGRVSRFRGEHGFSTTPPASELGHSPDHNTEAARQTASMLAGCGVNCNLAPVVDLDLFPANPIIGKYGRSFGNDPQVVIARARSWIEEHRSQNIVTCLKHFPGHGSSRTDSHLGFVDISETWQETELLPYQALIVENSADMIMVGHLFNNRLDPEFPATLSPATVQGLLRTRLGFNGVVISDDMQMKAITARYGLAEACIQALNAGVDMLILGNNLEHDPQLFVNIHTALTEAVAEGRVSEYRIEEAWNRVQSLKHRLRTQPK